MDAETKGIVAEKQRDMETGQNLLTQNKLALQKIVCRGILYKASNPWSIMIELYIFLFIF